jgi:hypothetical protein
MRDWRNSCRLWSSEFEDVLGGCDCASLEINLEAVMVPVWRCTWRPSWYKLGWRIRGRLEIRLEAVIEWDQRCAWRTWVCKNGAVFWGGNCGACRSVGRRAGSCDFIHWLTCNCENIQSWVQHDLQRDERLAGSRRQLSMGWRSMRCMPYSVYAVLSVCCTRCIPYSVLTMDYGMER